MNIFGTWARFKQSADDPDKKIAHYGGEVAGPVVRDIINDTLEYLGVAPNKLQIASEN